MAKDNRIYSKRLPIIVGAALLVLVVAVTVLAIVPAVTGANTKPTDPSEAPARSEQEDKASSEDLYCLEITKYSGAFVEDGTNEQVEDVAAILVQNRSDEFLDRATVTYDVSGKTATFIVTGLPPGEKAWVLEAQRMTIEEGAEFEFSDCVSAFRNDAVTKTELLEVTAEGNTLTVKNISDKTLQNVCLYYKGTHSDGSYLGGISYMIAFDTLEPDESQTKASAHYSENSRIVRYSYQTE